MSNESKQLLSGSANGRQILVAATDTPGTIIHTTLGDKSQYDEIWLYTHNLHSENVTLIVEWGGTTDPNDHMKTVIAPDIGIIQIVPGLILTNGVVVRAYADITNKMVISGFVCRTKRGTIR